MSATELPDRLYAATIGRLEIETATVGVAEVRDAAQQLRDLRARLDEHDAARIRATEALRGVQATEAGGFTGDPVVDGIGALLAEVERLTRDRYFWQCLSDAQYKQVNEAIKQFDATRAEAARLRAEVERLRAACERHAAAFSAIDYACGEPNDMQVSAYDVHCNEEAVAKRVKETIDAARFLASGWRRSAEQHGECCKQADGLRDALDTLMFREHQQLSELATAAGVDWNGLSHEQVVAAASERSRRLDRAERVVEAAAAYLDYFDDDALDDVAGADREDTLRSAFSAYREGR